LDGSDENFGGSCEESRGPRDPNEIQTVTIIFGAGGQTLAKAAGGSFTLTIDPDDGGPELPETESFSVGDNGDLRLKPTRSELQNGLEALPAIGKGNVLVSGGMEYSGVDESVRGGTHLSDRIHRRRGRHRPLGPLGASYRR